MTETTQEYMNRVLEMYDEHIHVKYEEWKTYDSMSFDDWAKKYHPRWYEQFGKK